MLKTALFVCAINEKCCSVDRGWGIWTHFLSPARGIWQLKSPRPRNLPSKTKKKPRGGGQRGGGGGGGCLELSAAKIGRCKIFRYALVLLMGEHWVLRFYGVSWRALKILECLWAAPSATPYFLSTLQTSCVYPITWYAVLIWLLFKTLCFFGFWLGKKAMKSLHFLKLGLPLVFSRFEPLKSCARQSFKEVITNFQSYGQSVVFSLYGTDKKVFPTKR